MPAHIPLQDHAVIDKHPDHQCDKHRRVIADQRIRGGVRLCLYWPFMLHMLGMHAHRHYYFGYQIFLNLGALRNHDCIGPPLRTADPFACRPPGSQRA